MKASVEEIKRHFEGAVEWLSDLKTGQTAIIDAPLALELVALAASATTPDARRMLDVGCGGGNYALKLLERLRDLDVTLLDLSETLLKRATDRVSAVAKGKVVALQGDIRVVNLGDEPFDIILAGAVLHHLREEAEWESVLAKLHAALSVGGSLWISDLTDHSTSAVREMMTERYGEYLVQLKGEEFRDLVFAEIAEQDTPRSLLFQVDMLRKVGFGIVEVLHKNACFATFGAIKSA